jgi:hypothetical protein
MSTKHTTKKVKIIALMSRPQGATLKGIDALDQMARAFRSGDALKLGVQGRSQVSQGRQRRKGRVHSLGAQAESESHGHEEDPQGKDSCRNRIPRQLGKGRRCVGEQGGGDQVKTIGLV